MARRAGLRRSLYLHGAAGVPPWLPFFTALAGKHQVLVPEHPGFGNSDNPSWIRNVGDMAMYYLDFLDELGERVHLVGAFARRLDRGGARGAQLHAARQPVAARARPASG